MDMPEDIIENKPVVRRAASLSDLRGEPTLVELLMPDNSILEVPFKILTHAEWQQIERDVPRPEPKLLAGKDGVYADTKDPDFQKKMAEWHDTVLYRRVLASIDIPIDGNSPEAKLETLRNTVSTPVMSGLISALTSLHFVQRARVVARAESFHPGADRDPATAGS